MYDAIVVGARCAGSTTAMLLARAGHRVLLLERGRFPSDTMSTHYVHQPAVARLARWGLLERLQATGCPPMELARWTLNDVSFTGCCPPVDGIRAAYGPRRYVLDTMLAHAAAESGAELREDCNVTGLVEEDGRVTGVRISSGGVESVEHARVVIGADGVDSIVAKTVEARMYEDNPTLSCLYYTYWSGFTADYEIYVGGGHAVGVVPTNDEKVMVGIQWPRAEFDEVRRDIEAQYMKTLYATAPAMVDRIEAGRREERFTGTGRLPNFYRQANGPGWALVGDAGYHKDPVGAYGISDALNHAELLVTHLDPALRGEGPIDDALATFGEERDRESMPRYQFNLEAAKFDPMPELLDILRAVRGDQTQLDRFLGMIAGLYTLEEFFTEELIDKAVADNESLAVAE
ncbi:MAG: NAD(P)/FAD-dependent oxidoreductase [Actinocatenispora sp.]